MMARSSAANKYSLPADGSRPPMLVTVDAAKFPSALRHVSQVRIDEADVKIRTLTSGES